METASIMGTPKHHGNTCLNASVHEDFSHISPALCSHENLKSPPTKRPFGNTKDSHGNTLGNTFWRIAAEHTSLAHNNKPAFTRVSMGFVERFGLCRNARYFPMQNRLKICPRRSSGVTSPVIDARAFCAIRSSSAKSSSCGRVERAVDMCPEVFFSARR